MRKQLRQPNRDEWLLDPMHGLEVGSEENNQPIFASDFLTVEAFEYYSAIQQKRPAYGIERRLRRFISRSIWPRLIIVRCRLLTSTATILFIDGHYKFLDKTLDFIRTILHCIGLIIHGLRLMITVAHMISLSTRKELYQYLAHAWFEVFSDSQSIVSALIPSDYLGLSCGLMGLELIMIAICGWNEQQRLLQHIKKIDLALNNQGLQVNQCQELLQSKAHAQAILSYNYKKFALTFGIPLFTTGLFVLKNILLPFIMVLAIHPLVPFIFAGVALLISILNHYLKQYIDQQKPKVLKELPIYPFFHAKPQCQRQPKEWHDNTPIAP